MIFDSHAHYDHEQFHPDREALFKKLPDEGIQYIINVASNMKSARSSIELAKRYPFIFASVGVHPHDVKELKEENLEHLIHLAAYEKVVAIGEIGLDYHYEYSPKIVQKLWFRHQLKIAKDLELPVIIHSREASQETFDIIMEAELEEPKGVIHCYSGSAEMAVEYTKAGFYIGVGGVITFDNARRLKETVEAIGLDKILIETDAPYLAPVPFRGKRNDSRLLVHVIDEIARIKGISSDEVEQATYENAKQLFFRHK